MSETKWMVNWKWGTFAPRFGQVEVAKVTAKRVQLVKRQECSGYRSHVELDEVFDTKAQAAESIRERALKCAAALRVSADEIEASIKDALK